MAGATAFLTEEYSQKGATSPAVFLIKAKPIAKARVKRNPVAELISRYWAHYNGIFLYGHI
jgi:hypothetical protein